jgi:hypothetical protein
MGDQKKEKNIQMRTVLHQRAYLNVWLVILSADEVFERSDGILEARHQLFINGGNGRREISPEAPPVTKYTTLQFALVKKEQSCIAVLAHLELGAFAEGALLLAKGDQRPNS